MAFVDIPTLNGGHVDVAAGSVYRLTHGVPGGNGVTLTRVEFGGEFQLTQMLAKDVAQILNNAGAKLVELTAPDGTEVFLSVSAVTAVRAADPHSDPPGANAVVTVAGHRQAVQQTQAQLQQDLSATA
jgi:hypothetical protein